MLELKILSPAGSVTLAASLPRALLSSAARPGAVGTPSVSADLMARCSRGRLFHQPAFLSLVTSSTFRGLPWFCELGPRHSTTLCRGDHCLSTGKGNEKEKQSHTTVFADLYGGHRIGENGHHHLRKRIFVSGFGANPSLSRLCARVSSVPNISFPFPALVVPPLNLPTASSPQVEA